MAARTGNSLPAQPRRAQGGADKESERTPKVRERARPGANAGIGRISGERRAMLRVTQTKSTISHIARNRATARALGLHGIGTSVDVVDNEATRGMVRQIRFLISVEELPAGGGPRRTNEAP